MSVVTSARCTMSMVVVDGVYRPQVRFEGPGVDSFTITWDEEDLLTHIELLQRLVNTVQQTNKAATERKKE